MIEITKDGLTLCNIQGNIFEKSLEYESSSSLIFIRRFMNSSISNDMDTLAFLDNTLTFNDVFDVINEKYGKTNYGKVKYNKEVLYWIGYIYRYFSYTYQLYSKQVYNIIKPKELNERYYIYHTFDCKQAIERILEEKEISFDNSNKRLLKLLRKQRYEDNIILKEMTNRDAYLLFKDYEYNTTFFNQNEYEEYLYNANNIESYITNCHNKGYKVIAVIYNDEVIGEIKFKNINNNIKELNIMLNSYYQNKGLGSVTIVKALKYAKEILKINTLNVKISNKDNKSIHIFKKLDFKYKDEDDNYVYFYKNI